MDKLESIDLIGNIPYGEGEERDAWGSIEYPVTLGYTKPNGEKYKVVIHDSDQSEYEYDKMFELCGYDVPFSVD